jgi:hypothetical protein
VAPSLVVAAWAIGAGLSAIRAAATRYGLEDLDLFAALFDQMGDVDVPVKARVWVVLVFSGWVRGMRGRCGALYVV